MKSRIIFVNRFFAPDVSATSQILSDVAFYLASVGCEVHVVCGDTLYNDKEHRLPAEETIQNVHIHRVSGGRFGRSGLAGRALDYLGLYVSLRRRVSNLLRARDILVAKTDPPLLTIPLAGLARSRRAGFVPWLQDLYPEVASALGVPLVSGVGERVLSALRDRSLKEAAAIIAIGERMRDRLHARGIPAERVHVIPNWSDDSTIVPVDYNKNQLRDTWGLNGKFVIGYSGNLGRAHEFETIIGAAVRLRHHENLAFLFVGGGHHVDQVRAEAHANGIADKFHFHPYQDRSQLAQSLSLPDVHWLSLRPELEGLIVPSKFYGIAAAGRAVLNVGALDGEIAQLASRFACGMSVAPGDSEGLALAIERLMTVPEDAVTMGQNGRRMLVDHYSRERAMERWENLLRNLA